MRTKSKTSQQTETTAHLLTLLQIKVCLTVLKPILIE